jgi:hypothetical protein
LLGQKHSYDAYYNLLWDTAVNYDKKRKSRRVDFHDTVDSTQSVGEDLYDTPGSHDSDILNDHAIDLPVDMFLNNHEQRRPFSQGQSPPGRVNIDHDIFRSLPQSVKDAIFAHNKSLPGNQSAGSGTQTHFKSGKAPAKRLPMQPPRRPPMKTRGVHFTEHEYEDDLIDHEEVDPGPPDNHPDDTQLIDAITGGEQDVHNDADIRNVLSAYKMKQTTRPRKDKDKQEAKVHKVTINGHEHYREVNAHVTYRVSKSISNRTGSLVDRGANGGVAGNDVKVWSRTGRKVDVAGIDNHTMNDPLPTLYRLTPYLI